MRRLLRAESRARGVTLERLAELGEERWRAYVRDHGLDGDVPGR